MLAARYGEVDVEAGCESDFDVAAQATDATLTERKAAALTLTGQPENVRVLGSIAAELRDRETLAWEQVDLLIGASGGEPIRLRIRTILYVLQEMKMIGGLLPPAATIVTGKRLANSNGER